MPPTLAGEFLYDKDEFQSWGRGSPQQRDGLVTLNPVVVSIRGGGDGREGPAAPDRSKHHLLLTIFLKASLNSR